MRQLVGGGIVFRPRLSLLHYLVRSRIYLRNYRYDDYDRARPRSVEYSSPRGNMILSISLSSMFSSALSLYSLPLGSLIV